MRNETDRGGERGQTLILAAFLMTVVFVIGAIAIDVGLWLSERRGAQTDADFSSLAGAWELLNPSGSAAAAITAATNSLSANNEQGNASLAQPVAVDDSCFHQGKNDAVSVDVNHGTKSLFASIFSVAAPNPGAHAKACAGAANAPNNIIPFEISNGPGPCFDTNAHPIFTAMCGLELGAQGDNPRGMLDLQAPSGYCSDATGGANIEDLIINGAPGTCLINTSGNCNPANNGPWDDCVAVQNGNPKDVLDGVEKRLAKEGLCDSLPGSNHDGIDDFSESVQMIFNTGDPLTSIYAPRDCDPSTDGLQVSPRLITIIVLNQVPTPGNTGYPIVAFAGFYLAGCAPEGQPVTSEADLNRHCTTTGAMMPSANDKYIQDLRNGLPVPVRTKPATPTPSPTLAPTPTPSPVPSPTPAPGPPGHEVVYGRFVNIIVAGSGVGPPGNSTTSFSIALKE